MKFKQILYSEIEKLNKHQTRTTTDINLSVLSRLDISSDLQHLAKKKKNIDVIELSESFKNNDAISRYYDKTGRVSNNTIAYSA